MLIHMTHPRTIFQLAMACLAVFGILGFIHPPSTFSEDMIDATRGALLGATITLLYLRSRIQRNRGG